MRLYVISPDTKRKIFLKVNANSRIELKQIIKKDHFTVKGKRYSINDVHAMETDASSTSSGAIIGGLIGLLGGPIGVAIGVTAGSLLGSSFTEDEKKKVKSFNRKKYVK